jgi:hypothetical protein
MGVCVLSMALKMTGVGRCGQFSENFIIANLHQHVVFFDKK